MKFIVVIERSNSEIPFAYRVEEKTADEALMWAAQGERPGVTISVFSADSALASGHISQPTLIRE